MLLKDYLDRRGETMAAFSRRIGVTPEAVRWYCNGERVPRYNSMRRIVAATRGKVKPNDFYDLHSVSGD